MIATTAPDGASVADLTDPVAEIGNIRPILWHNHGIRA
jgi:hypothetical protein